MNRFKVKAFLKVKTKILVQENVLLEVNIPENKILSISKMCAFCS